MEEAFYTKIVFFITVFDTAKKQEKKLNLVTFNEYYRDMAEASNAAKDHRAELLACNNILWCSISCHITMQNSLLAYSRQDNNS